MLRDCPKDIALLLFVTRKTRCYEVVTMNDVDQKLTSFLYPEWRKYGLSFSCCFV